MQSSVSANIITQLGYLQNYAGKGHFLTRERFGGAGGLALPARAPAPPPRGPAAAPPGLRGCGAVPAGPERAGGRSVLPPTPRGGWGPHTPLPLHFPSLPPRFFFFFPAARAPGAHRRRYFVLQTLRRHDRDVLTGRRESAFWGFKKKCWFCLFVFLFFISLFGFFFFRSQHAPRERTARGRRGTRGSGPRTAAAAGTGERGHCAPSGGARTDRRSGGGEGPGLGCAGVVPQSCRRGAAV